VAIEVYKIKNVQTEKYEYFEGDNLPQDDEKYDLANKELINNKDSLLTLGADLAYEYGLARTVVEGLDEQAREETLAYLEERDQITFERPAQILKTNWSEELVRMLTSPAVTGILFMVALLGIYAELNSPGVGLPGAVAVAALIVLFGSKYLIGMANWWEIAVFAIGMGLMMMEIFVIPGFGVAGISGVLLMIFAIGAMMVGNPPEELPIPASPLDWTLFEQNLQGLMAGFIGFCIFAYFIGKYFPRLPLTSRLVLTMHKDPVSVRAGGIAAPAPEPQVTVGEEGISVSELRPSGIARFGKNRLNVVTHGEPIETGRKIKVVVIEGNSIVVKEL
jgi:membrane-bound serine protease (ClpP class)